MNHFDIDTQLTALGPGRWSGQVSAAWNIGDNPNGGYLIACCARALRLAVAHKHPLSLTTHFLRPGVAGEFTVVLDVLKEGRTLSTVRASLLQHGKSCLELLATYGELSSSRDIGFGFATAPLMLPAPEDCPPRSGAAQGIRLPILERVDIRIHPDQVQGGQCEKAEISGWIRFKDGREPDAESLLLFADAFPPAAFAKLGAVGWVPTIEMTIHVRRSPSPGWIRAHFWTEDLQHSRMIENGQLWDATGNLVAQSRQIGLFLPR